MAIEQKHYSLAAYFISQHQAALAPLKQTGLLPAAAFELAREDVATMVGNLETGVAQVAKLKVVVLGAAEAGKSSMCDALRSRRFRTRAVLDRTIGVDVVPLVIGRGVELAVWDTAGQEGYYGGQQPFMTPDALYICLFDASKLKLEQIGGAWQVSECSANGSHIAKSVLTFLHAVHARSPGAKAVVVGSKLDLAMAETGNDRTTNGLICDFVRREVERTWATPGEGLHVLRYHALSSATRHGIRQLHYTLSSLAEDASLMPEIRQNLPLCYLALEALLPQDQSPVLGRNCLQEQGSQEACAVCCKQFSVFRARIRHSCYWCGRVVCGDCSSKKLWPGGHEPADLTSEGAVLVQQHSKLRLCMECEVVSDQQKSALQTSNCHSEVQPYLDTCIDANTQIELRGVLSAAPYITLAELKALDLNAKLGFSDETGLEAALRFLNKVGRVTWFYDHPAMCEYVVFRPQWLLDAWSCLTRHDFQGVHRLLDSARTTTELRQLCLQYTNNAHLHRDLCEHLWNADTQQRFPVADHDFLLHYMQFGAGLFSCISDRNFLVHSLLGDSSESDPGGLVDSTNIWLPHSTYCHVEADLMKFQRRLFTCAHLPFGLIGVLQVLWSSELDQCAVPIMTSVKTERAHFKDGSVLLSKHQRGESVVIHFRNADLARHAASVAGGDGALWSHPMEVAVIGFTPERAPAWDLFHHVTASIVQTVTSRWPGLELRQWTPCAACIAMPDAGDTGVVGLFDPSDWVHPSQFAPTEQPLIECRTNDHCVVRGNIEGEFVIPGAEIEDESPLSPSKLTLSTELLGEGSCAVFAAEWTGRGEPELVAAKRIPFDVDITNEVDVLRTVQHSNVVIYHALERVSSDNYIVLERCDCNLLEAIDAGPSAELDARALCIQMVSAVAYLHSIGIAHR